MSSNTIHATCVSISGKGVLLAGEAGCGKSDVALRLIDAGAELVSDDQTVLSIKENQLIASAPAAIAGLMELRNIGLFRLPYKPEVVVSLYVELVPENEILERMPKLDDILLLDRSVRRLSLRGHASSTPAKIRAALTYTYVTDD